MHLPTSPIDWGAVATLVGAGATLTAGIVAVFAALIVGAKQTKIASRQVEMLDRQTKLAEANLRADLFDRRLATYEITADFVLYMHTLGDPTEQSERSAIFATKMRESIFLFSPQVYPALLQIWEAANTLRVARSISIQNYSEQLPSDPKIAAAIEDGLAWSYKRLGTLHEVFSHDLGIDAARLSASS